MDITPNRRDSPHKGSVIKKISHVQMETSNTKMEERGFNNLTNVNRNLINVNHWDSFLAVLEGGWNQGKITHIANYRCFGIFMCREKKRKERQAN